MLYGVNTVIIAELLSDLTHQDGTAWSKADSRNDSYLEDREIFEEESYNVANY